MRTRTPVALIALCLTLAASAPSAAVDDDEVMVLSEYTVVLNGSCPGLGTMEWSGATPNRRQAVVFGREEGKTIIPQGACEGTVLGIAVSVQVYVVIGTREGSGVIGFHYGQSCRGFVQLVETGTCRTSNVTPLP